MSSNKIRRIDDNFRRDSFENRVCDDLCEVLLQFLPLKDKFKFECVSCAQSKCFNTFQTITERRLNGITINV